MFVRYQTARNIAIGVLAAALFGYFIYSMWGGPPPTEPPVKNRETKQAAPPLTPSKTSGPPEHKSPTPTPSPVPPHVELPSPKATCSARVLALFAGKASTKKLKDASRGQGCKVNLYDDDGDGTWDRAKVDENRDGTWDESWVRKHGQIERKIIARNQVLVWRNGSWQAKTK